MRGRRGWVGLALLLTMVWPEDASAQGRRDRGSRDDEGEREDAGERAEGERDDGRRGDRRRRDDEEGDKPAGYDDWKPYALRDDIEIEAWWWSAARTALPPFDQFSVGSTFAFALGGQSMMTENVALGFRFPWTFNARPYGPAIGALGNPTLDVHYAAQASIVTWHAGAGVSAPLASIEDDAGLYRLAAVLGGWSLAGYDSYLFAPAVFPLRAYGGVELRATRGVSIRLGVDPIFLPPLEAQDFQFVLQEHVDAIFLSKPGFGGGVRFQGAHPLTSDLDKAQLSVEPYLAYDDEQSFFAKVGLLMALDTPLGFAFEEGKVLSLHVAIGGYTGGDETDGF